MRRGSRLRKTVALLLLCMLAVACTHPSAPQASGPNFLIIVTDDQRIGSLRVMPQTRHFFLDGGTNFKQAFVTTPLCCPSRSSIFSGLYAHNHGVVNNEPGLAEHLDQQILVQHYLHDAGYRTALFGKYLNKWRMTQAPPSFDDYDFFSEGERYYGGTWDHNGEIVRPPTYSTTYIQLLAERFLQRAESNDSQPWFLYLATAAPHGPSTPETRYQNAPVGQWAGNPAVFEKDRSDKPRYVQQDHASLRRGRHVRRRQFRSLRSVDSLVGSVLSLLRRLGEEGDTLVFFISDNGITWADHGIRGKAVPYTPSIKVPLMMRWPGHVPARRTDHDLVANIDIAPSIMEAAHLTPSRPMDGHSLLHPVTRRSLLTEYTFMPKYNVPTWASIRTRSWQYIQDYNPAGTKVNFREYYNLRRDPFELHNLLADKDHSNDPNVKKLAQRLAGERTCSGRSCP